MTDAGDRPEPHKPLWIVRRCPQCNIQKPILAVSWDVKFRSREGGERIWRTYGCQTCGGAVLVELDQSGNILRSWPSDRSFDSSIPERARELLDQVADSLVAPAGAVILAAGAVDAMLKSKGLTTGSLYDRIEQAAERHLITQEMSSWAHDVRLDSNDQRHADMAVPLATRGEAERALAFAEALAEFLFVLPARVTRGRKAAAP